MVLGRFDIWRLGALIVAFGLGAFPQLGIALCVAYGLAAVVYQRIAWRRRTWWWAMVAYALLRVPWQMRGGGAGAWYGLLEVAFAVGVLFGAAALRTQFSKRLAIAAALGALVAVTAAALPVWSFATPTQSWYAPSSLVDFTSDRGVDTLTPLNEGNAWVHRDLGSQGSGEIDYRFELRSERPTEVTVWFQRPDLADDLRPQTCVADNTRWRVCSVSAKLTQRMTTVFVIGAWETWKSSSGPLQFRNAEIRILQQPTWTERLFHSNRAVGWSFNENGFGIWMTCVAALIFASSGPISGAWFLAVPCAIGVLISGSRNALIALLLISGLLIVAGLRSERSRLVAAVIAVLIALLTTILIATGVQSGRGVDFLSDNGRFKIYHIAWDLAWQHPLIGWGDFALALRESTAGSASGAVSHAHSLWLQTFGESGLLGVACLITLIVVLAYHVFRTRDKTMLAILIILIFVNSIDYFLYYSPVFFLFWLTFTGIKPRKPILSNSS